MSCPTGPAALRRFAVTLCVARPRSWKRGTVPVIAGARKVWELLGGTQAWRRSLAREALWVVLLDARLHLLGIDEIASGAPNEVIVPHVADVFRSAIARNATAIVLIHNHPSGDPNPSAADRDLTAQVRQAGQMLGVRLVDSVIFGHDSYYSFVDAGLLGPKRVPGARRAADAT